MPGPPAPPSPTEVIPERHQPRASRTARALGAVGAALLVGAVAWLMANVMSSPNDSGVLDVPIPTQPAEITPAPTPTPSPTPEPTPEPDGTEPPLLDLPGLDLGAPAELDGVTDRRPVV